MRTIIIAGLLLMLAGCSQEPPPAQVDQPATELAEDALYATSPDPMASDDSIQVVEQPAEALPQPGDEASTGTLVAEEMVEEPAPRAAATGPGVIQLAQAPGAPADGRFREGRHYQRLSPAQPTSSGPDVIEVAEVFWYGCPHCYEFEPFVQDWKSRAPEGVSVVSIPATWNPLLQLHARAFYTAEYLGVLEDTHMAFFREYHERRNPLDSEARIRDFFTRQGVDGADFDRGWNSFGVQSRLQRAEQLARRYRVTGVPMLVVNGKYAVDGRSAGGLRQMLDVAEELIVLEKAAR
jgi:protein dithiol oxidoreductase (disulfide-forming)